MTSIALVPLDERPVCAHLPASIARIAGLECAVPPADLLPSIRKPGNVAGLLSWVTDQRRSADRAVISLEGLGFGGLIPSRIGQESTGEVLERWNVLREPGAPVFASSLVPRTPDSLDAMEEPEYWDPFGPALHELSAALHTGVGLDEARAAVPEWVRKDWIARRLRQHTLSLFALELVGDGVIDRLVIGIDDAAEASLSASDQDQLNGWVDRRELGDHVFVQPGADEVGAVLVARACLDVLGVTAPRIRVWCADPTALDRVAPYESSPVRETIRRQIEAAGGIAVFEPACRESPGDCDAILVVHPPEIPSNPPADWAVAPGASLDTALAHATAQQVAAAQQVSPIVGLADVARPNGTDPQLVSAMDAAGAWTGLSGFAGWNTAGNTVGTVAAQLVATWAGTQSGTINRGEVHRAVGRRIVEDFGWMSVERARVRSELASPSDRHDAISPADVTNLVLHDAETRLNGVLKARPGFEDLRVTPGSLTLPWNRTFEIDLSIGSVA